MLTLRIERITATGEASPVALAQIDNFAMRNFTNEVAFDDTLPIADGLMEVGLLVPLDRLHTAMEHWFRRKRYLASDEVLRLTRIVHRVD